MYDMNNFFDVIINKEFNGDILKTFFNIFNMVNNLQTPTYTSEINFKILYCTDRDIILISNELLNEIKDYFDFEVDVLYKRLSKIKIQLKENINIQIEIRSLENEFIQRGDKFDLILFDLYKKRDIYKYLNDEIIQGLNLSLIGRYYPIIQTILVYEKK